MTAQNGTGAWATAPTDLQSIARAKRVAAAATTRMPEAAQQVLGVIERHKYPERFDVKPALWNKL